MSAYCRSRGFILLPVSLLLSLVAAMAFLGHRETSLGSAMASGTDNQDKARYAAEAGLQRATLQAHTKGCAGIYPIILSPVKDTAFDGASYSAFTWNLSGSPVTVQSTGTYGDASVTLTRAEVPMHQAVATTMTLQPAAEGIDAYLDTANSSSNASKIALVATSGTSSPILQFDLSAVPAGSHVTSATLSTYATSGSGSAQVALHRVMRDWTENATWATSDGSASWAVAGGDVHAQAVASTAFTAAGAWLNWDVTALADRWIKGSLPNQGVLVRAAAGISGLQLASSDNPTAAQRPKLAVTFLPPCGWTPPSTTVTLAPVADVDIDKNLPSSNFGIQPDLYLSKGYEAKPLLKFDVSTILAGSVVQTAKLRLYFSAVTVMSFAATKTSVNLELEVHAATKAWDELQATWQRRISSTNWTKQGGDYRSAIDATKSLDKNSAPGVWFEFTVTSLVQEWIDGVTTNNGLILVLPTASTEELIFASREAASNRPELVVTYK